MYFSDLKKQTMAKETIVKENPVIDALKKLKEEEMELTAKLKPVQEAIGALEKILDKSSKKAKPAKETTSEAATEETTPEATEEEATA
jgi:histone deacetylase complex regulatory component SIN3